MAFWAYNKSKDLTHAERRAEYRKSRYKRIFTKREHRVNSGRCLIGSSVSRRKNDCNSGRARRRDYFRELERVNQQVKELAECELRDWGFYNKRENELIDVWEERNYRWIGFDERMEFIYFNGI